MTWPYMVKKFPLLREYVYRRYFLMRSTALFNLSLLGVVMGTFFHWVYAVLILPYFLEKYVSGKKYGNPLIRAGRAIACYPRGAVLFAVLLYGSIRFRSFLL